jgi:hypothetical protein
MVCLVVGILDGTFDQPARLGPVGRIFLLLLDGANELVPVVRLLSPSMPILLM